MAGAAQAAGEAARLVLLTADDSGYKLARLHAQYRLEHEDGDAYTLSPDAWYAIGLEVGGKATPFLRHERVRMQVFDERDPEVGVQRLARYNSPAPWRNGVHYFRALDWRAVGAYRITFRAAGMRRFGGDGAVGVLQFMVVCHDPGEWPRAPPLARRGSARWRPAATGGSTLSAAAARPLARLPHEMQCTRRPQGRTLKRS